MVKAIRIPKRRNKPKAETEMEVSLGNLRVMISNHGGSWMAQGLEIDYFAEGSTLKDVQTRFQKGLAATLGEYLKVYGKLDALLQPAPQSVWQQFFAAHKEASESKRCFLHSQVSWHKDHEEGTHGMPDIEGFPFGGIDYYRPKSMTA